MLLKTYKGVEITISEAGYFKSDQIEGWYETLGELEKKIDELMKVKYVPVEAWVGSYKHSKFRKVKLTSVIKKRTVDDGYTYNTIDLKTKQRSQEYLIIEDTESNRAKIAEVEKKVAEIDRINNEIRELEKTMYAKHCLLEIK